MAEKVSYTVVDQGASTHYTLDWETFVASLDRIWEPSWTVWLFSTQCFYWPAICWAHQHFIGVPFTPETSQHSCDGRWPRERKSQNRWGQYILYALRCVNWHRLIRRNSSIEPCACLLSLVLVYWALCLYTEPCACILSLVLVYWALCLYTEPCACILSLVLVYTTIYSGAYTWNKCMKVRRYGTPEKLQRSPKQETDPTYVPPKHNGCSLVPRPLRPCPAFCHLQYMYK